MEEDKKVELDSDIWKKYEKKKLKIIKKYLNLCRFIILKKRLKSFQ